MRKRFYPKLKRLFDLIIAFSLLVLLSPLLVLIAIAIKLENKGSFLFKQVRIGYDSKPFTIYKFRTMVEHAPAYVATNDLTDPHLYITKVGALLRKTSTDELLQLINILRNEMSLIGPRPVIPEETQLIEQRKALGADQVRPGVTGLAQINGRDDLEPEVKALYDSEYVKKMSFVLDAKIFFVTIIKILKSEHVNH